MAVLAFKPKNSHSGDNPIPESEWLNLIAAELRIKIRGGVRMYSIAEKTGLSFTTISNIVCGKTKFPRMNTVAVLMKFLGYRLIAQKK